MSEESSFWIGLAEKFFGLLLTIIGVLMIYYSATSGSNLNVFAGFFVFLSALLLIAGLFLLLVRPSE
jgi:uncharacterized membrane protein